MGIENSCHWSLDFTFREDESRIREKNLRENFAWLNRFLLSLLKQHPSKESVVGRRQTCGWDENFLLQVLTWAPPTAQKRVVNKRVYNFSASCGEVDRKDPNWDNALVAAGPEAKADMPKMQPNWDYGFKENETWVVYNEGGPPPQNKGLAKPEGSVRATINVNNKREFTIVVVYDPFHRAYAH